MPPIAAITAVFLIFARPSNPLPRDRFEYLIVGIEKTQKNSVWCRKKDRYLLSVRYLRALFSNIYVLFGPAKQKCI